MKTKPSIISILFDKILSEKVKNSAETVIIGIAIFSFLLHLLVIFVNISGWIEMPFESDLLDNPIDAIYTPFSFILLYEVFLLVYYLPKSISTYIRKQYEIIALIVVRRIFKDISNMSLEVPALLENAYDRQLLYDLVTTVLLFGLIYIFHRLVGFQKSLNPAEENQSIKLKRLIFRKKFLALFLLVIFVGLALYSLFDWLIHMNLSQNVGTQEFRDINEVFFNEFFTVLILTDVLLLLFSLFHSDKFSMVVRNSGFIISTILIRLSFSVDGIVNNLLILLAVLFGVLMFYIYNKFEEAGTPKNKIPSNAAGAKEGSSS